MTTEMTRSDGPERRYRKVYVTMNVQMRRDGSWYPKSIIWEDGRLYRVERVLGVTRAAAQKVGGCGDRYTLVVEGHERYFFNDNGRWFTEAPVLPETGEIPG